MSVCCNAAQHGGEPEFLNWRLRIEALETLSGLRELRMAQEVVDCAPQGHGGQCLRGSGMPVAEGLHRLA